MRLPALVDLDLEIGVTGLEGGDEAVEPRRVLARQDREKALPTDEHAVDDLVQDRVEIRPGRDGRIVDEPEVGTFADVDAVELRVT